MGAPGTTPGPWRTSKRASRRVTSHHGVVICNAVLRNQGGPKAKSCLKDEHEAEANALQLAASSAMYDALAGIQDMLTGRQDILRAIQPLMGPAEYAALKQVADALAAARGES